MNKEELLKVLDMDSDNQFWSIQKYLPKDLANLYDTQEISLADLAFRLSGGKIAGKKPIEYIIDALIAKESK